MWGLSQCCENTLWQGGLWKEAPVENEMSREQSKTHALMRVNLLAQFFIIISFKSLLSTFSKLQRGNISGTERFSKCSLCYMKDI